MINEQALIKYVPPNLAGRNDVPKFLTLPGFGTSADLARARAFLDWRDLYLRYAQLSPYCGYMLEKMVFDTALKTDHYHVIGDAPSYGTDGLLEKSSGSEVLVYQGNLIYQGEHGAGFDLFMIHKSTDVPIGIEAKNKREWLYPASLEVWRAIARACSLKCLPVIVTRKISYVARAGFFAKFGILGFETHSQYFNQKVQPNSTYNFKDKVTHKDRLGFSDISLIKPSETITDNMLKFFDVTLPGNVEEYFEKFMENYDLLKKYSIDYGMGKNEMSQYERFQLYTAFMAEANAIDVEVPLELPSGFVFQ